MVASPSSTGETLISVEKFRAAFGPKVVLDDVTFSVRRGEVVCVIGDSGCGKSTLMKHLIGLYRPAAGRIVVEGRDVAAVRGEDRRALLRSFGVAYQSGALFGSMSLTENIRIPLEQFTDLPAPAMDSIALAKLALVGLDQAANLLPSQISGGMQKRAAIARAMALDPRILFLDEPSSGLDPITSASIDRLILELRSMLGTTFVVITHELPSIFAIADRCIVLSAARRTKVADGPPEVLRTQSGDPWLRSFLNRQAEGASAAKEAP